MASDKLKIKWRMWFKCLDTNHDDVLSHKDTVFTKDMFATLHHFDIRKREEASKQFEDWFGRCILKGIKDDECLTEDQFVDMLDKEYKTDGKKGFLADIIGVADKFLQAIDKDHKGDFLTEEDFKLLYLAYGHIKIANDHEAFQGYNPVDGKIRMDDYIDAWIKFLTDDDESLDNPVRKQFERDGF